MEEKLTEADEGNEQTDARADGHDERLGHDTGEPLTETEKGQDEEDPPARSILSMCVLRPIKPRHGS